DHAHSVRCGYAVGAAAVASNRHCAGGGRRAARRGAAVAAAGAVGSGRPSLLLAAGARLLHLRIPTRLHHRAHARISGRSRPFRASRRLDDRGDRPVQYRRLARFGLARQSHAQALSSFLHLFRARRRGARLHHVPGDAAIFHPVRRRHGPALALNGRAYQRHHCADLRHTLARHPRRRGIFQPSGRRLPRRVARRRRVRAYRLLRRGVVALGSVRLAFRGDQPADRGEAGRARGRRAGLRSGTEGRARAMQTASSTGADSSQSAVIAASAPRSWRTPALILACGCLIALISFGARSGLGFFLTPMSSAHGWGRDVFALALAIQMLLWGAAQPVAGALADRYGATPVLSAGAVLYAIGLASMAYASTAGMLHLTAGAVIGFGLAGASFTIVIGAFGKLMSPQWRSLAFGAGTT